MFDKREGLRSALGRFRPFLRPVRFSTSGKITLFAISGVAAALLVVGVISFNAQVPTVSADSVSTSVTVLNTPPQWTVDVQEYGGSSTSTPTNAGSVLTWFATGTDSNADDYWLIICSASSTPTPHASSAPTCSSGFQWAVSGITTSGAIATAATTTIEKAPFANESNAWFGYICDGNPALPQCNTLVKQGTGTTSSPFVIDHPPVFSSLSISGTVNPGGTVTWSTIATTTDLLRGGDRVVLYICSTNVFINTSTTTGCGGTMIASSSAVTINATAPLTVTIPTQDTLYPAYAFLTNNFNLQATSTLQGSSTPYTVNNVAPTITASSIALVDRTGTSTPTLILVTPNATSGPYKVTFQAVDNNSCLNSSSGHEISSIVLNAYRSGFGSTSCQTSGNFNSNKCYPSLSPLTDFSCTEDAGQCTGASDVNTTFTCTFSLWYNADPTDTGSQFPTENWLATVKAIDDQGASSTLTEATTGTKLTSFLAFAITQTSIAFGGLQPGQQIDPLSVATTTTMKALGNVGLDESLYGSTMCTNWSALGGGSNPDACDTIGVDPTRQIPILNQKAATTTLTYAAATAVTASTSPVYLALHVPKTISTSSPQNKDTLWGIKIPVAITVAGAYTGQNTITAMTASSTNW